MGGIHDDETGYYDGEEGIPLNDTTRMLIVIIHYVAVPVVTFAMYGAIKNIGVIEERIWSPFLLVTALSWLLLATSFEISNHYYVDDWQLHDPKSDLINGSFSFFNFGAQNLMALSLRKKGVRFARVAKSYLDWTSFILDPCLALLIVANPIVYGCTGRSVSVKALSPLASIAALFTMFRVWINLGPNAYTKFGGIGFFVLVICGVTMNVLYNATGDEWIHALIGGSFISSTIPLGIAFFNAELSVEKEEEEEEANPKEAVQEEDDQRVEAIVVDEDKSLEYH